MLHKKNIFFIFFYSICMAIISKTHHNPQVIDSQATLASINGRTERTQLGVQLPDHIYIIYPKRTQYFKISVTINTDKKKIPTCILKKKNWKNLQNYNNKKNRK